MVKKLLYTLMFLISIVGVSALYGGESTTIYDEECEYLEIMVAGISEIEEGEFMLSENCNGTEDFFTCSCEIPTVFTTKTNTVNTYTVTIDVWKMVEPTTISSGSGSSSPRKYQSISIIEPEPISSEGVGALPSVDQGETSATTSEGLETGTGILEEEEETQGQELTGMVIKEEETPSKAWAWITNALSRVKSFLLKIFGK